MSVKNFEIVPTNSKDANFLEDATNKRREQLVDEEIETKKRLLKESVSGISSPDNKGDDEEGLSSTGMDLQKYLI
jgi:hypothetical protein